MPVHYVELVTEIPGKRIVRFRVPVQEDGRWMWREMEGFDTSGDGAHANWPDQLFAKIERLSMRILPGGGTKEGLSR
jgi:aminoglycoside 3-N-acetyltransferase